MQFNTPYNRSESFVGENYKNVPSVTQPEQVMPLKRILDGLKNGTIVLPAENQVFDIPEHEIDVQAGQTATQTNANIAAATSADLAESADNFGEDITAHPGFQIEDTQEFTDAVEAAIANQVNAEADGEQAAQTQNAAADKPNAEALAQNQNAAADTAAA